jgi:hypothetical protein
MSDLDQETEARLAKIRGEWQQLEAQRELLEAEHAAWLEKLLAEADRLGMGERFRQTLRQSGKGNHNTKSQT